jgi:hypothetical protein
MLERGEIFAAAEALRDAAVATARDPAALDRIKG